MNNFFYFFLLSLLVFNEWDIFYAHTLNLRSLENSPREINLGKWENIKNKVLVKRTPQVKTESRSYFTKTGFYPPTVFLQNTYPYTHTDGLSYNQLHSNPAIRWKAETAARRCIARLHKRKSKLLRKKRKEATKDIKKLKRYLDYSNSQMPFNEGKSRCSKVNEPIPKVKETEQKSSECDKKYESNLASRYEDLQDNLQEEYSRVRRFLDRERAKKRVRAVNTLDEKEAAMSRVLDPSLNLDGILEPHIRKRREKP